jgi:hypothetical protein
MAPQSEVNRLASLKIRQQAIEIFRRNDRGGYTVPTATGLYPAQWNWDSCLVALGLAQFDEPRAVSELDTLFNGQWSDGMVPHILFHGDDSSYSRMPRSGRRGQRGDPQGSHNRLSRLPWCGTSSSAPRIHRPDHASPR